MTFNEFRLRNNIRIILREADNRVVKQITGRQICRKKKKCPFNDTFFSYFTKRKKSFSLSVATTYVRLYNH